MIASRISGVEKMDWANRGVRFIEFLWGVFCGPKYQTAMT
jgi:hypothetical protein